jgi:hypothetical protein
LVCERPLERKSSSQQTCGRRKCRAALADQKAANHFIPGNGAGSPHFGSNSSDISTSKTAIRADRLSVVAGPQLTPSQLRCANVPDGPGCRWVNGEYRRIETKNAAALATEQIEAGGDFSEPHWHEVVSPNGVVVQVARLRRATR